MTAHVSDDLPRLLTGEASRDVVLDAAKHLRTCIDCQQALVLAVVAHASLTSAQRFAPDIVGTPTVVATPDEAPEPAATETTLPDLSPLFARVRDEAAAAPKLRRTRLVRYGVLAAAAAAVVGGGSYAVVQSSDGSPDSTVHTVALQAFDHGTTRATVTVRDTGQLDVDAASLPKLGAQHYEVWLTNARRTQMQPIGWLNSNGKATLSVPSGLLNRFSDIEVSVQNLAASSYSYSGTSVLRGAYT
jgi:hypothetical protein